MYVVNNEAQYNLKIFCQEESAPRLLEFNSARVLISPSCQSDHQL